MSFMHPNSAVPAKHAFFVMLSVTEEVIYVLFGYGSLVWRIGSGKRDFFSEPHTEAIWSTRLAVQYPALYHT